MGLGKCVDGLSGWCSVRKAHRERPTATEPRSDADRVCGVSRTIHPPAPARKGPRTTCASAHVCPRPVRVHPHRAADRCRDHLRRRRHRESRGTATWVAQLPPKAPPRRCRGPGRENGVAKAIAASVVSFNTVANGYTVSNQRHLDGRQPPLHGQPRRRAVPRDAPLRDFQRAAAEFEHVRQRRLRGKGGRARGDHERVIDAGGRGGDLHEAGIDAVADRTTSPATRRILRGVRRPAAFTLGELVEFGPARVLLLAM